MSLQYCLAFLSWYIAYTTISTDAYSFEICELGPNLDVVLDGIFPGLEQKIHEAVCNFGFNGFSMAGPLGQYLRQEAAIVGFSPSSSYKSNRIAAASIPSSESLSGYFPSAYRSSKPPQSLSSPLG